MFILFFIPFFIPFIPTFSGEDSRSILGRYQFLLYKRLNALIYRNMQSPCKTWDVSDRVIAYMRKTNEDGLTFNRASSQTIDDVLDQAEIQDNDGDSDKYRACCEAGKMSLRQVKQANSHRPHIPVF